jgi:hypothetical protein
VIRVSTCSSDIEASADLTAEEREYRDLYGLDDEQIAWRRGKIVELKDEALFRQEYPANAAEAFQQSGHDSYIPPALVAKARKSTSPASGPLVIGFDPAWMGEDRHAMAWRRGRRVEKVESRTRLSTMAAAGWLKQVIDRDRPKRVFVDVGGVGAGIYDRLGEMGYGAIVRAVNFGSAPLEPPPRDEHGEPSGGPLNRRAEMWMKSREWLEDPAGAAVPDLDSLQADACGPTYTYDSNSRLKLEAKDHMRARREVARRMGRGRAHLRRAGRAGCGVQAADRVSRFGGRIGHGLINAQPQRSRRAHRHVRLRPKRKTSARSEHYRV